MGAGASAANARKFGDPSHAGPVCIGDSSQGTLSKADICARVGALFHVEFQSWFADTKDAEGRISRKAFLEKLELFHMDDRYASETVRDAAGNEGALSVRAQLYDAARAILVRNAKESPVFMYNLNQFVQVKDRLEAVWKAYGDPPRHEPERTEMEVSFDFSVDGSIGWAGCYFKGVPKGSPTQIEAKGDENGTIIGEAGAAGITEGAILLEYGGNKPNPKDSGSVVRGLNELAGSGPCVTRWLLAPSEEQSAAARALNEEAAKEERPTDKLNKHASFWHHEERVNGETRYVAKYRQQRLGGSGEPVANVDELMEAAAAAQAQFPVVLGRVLQAAGLPTTPYDHATHTGHLMLAPLKGRQRVLAKCEAWGDVEPGPTCAWVADCVRGTYLCEKPQEIDALLTAFKDKGEQCGAELSMLNNRCSQPLYQGYRDINLGIMITLDDGTKHVTELQLHLRELKSEGVRLLSHETYEYFRHFFQNNHRAVKANLDKILESTSVARDGIISAEQLVKTAWDLRRPDAGGTRDASFYKKVGPTLDVLAAVLRSLGETDKELEVRKVKYEHAYGKCWIRQGFGTDPEWANKDLNVKPTATSVDFREFCLEMLSIGRAEVTMRPTVTYAAGGHRKNDRLLDFMDVKLTSDTGYAGYQDCHRYLAYADELLARCARAREIKAKFGSNTEVWAYIEATIAQHEGFAHAAKSNPKQAFMAYKTATGVMAKLAEGGSGQTQLAAIRAECEELGALVQVARHVANVEDRDARINHILERALGIENRLGELGWSSGKTPSDAIPAQLAFADAVVAAHPVQFKFTGPVGPEPKRRTKDIVQAKQKMECALKVYRRELGDTHPKNAPVHAAMGGLFRVMGKYAEAIAEFRRACEMNYRAFGTEENKGLAETEYWKLQAAVCRLFSDNSDPATLQARGYLDVDGSVEIGLAGSYGEGVQFRKFYDLPEAPFRPTDTDWPTRTEIWKPDARPTAASIQRAEYDLWVAEVKAQQAERKKLELKKAMQAKQQSAKSLLGEFNALKGEVLALSELALRSVWKALTQAETGGPEVTVNVWQAVGQPRSKGEGVVPYFMRCNVFKPVACPAHTLLVSALASCMNAQMLIGHFKHKDPAISAVNLTAYQSASAQGETAMPTLMERLEETVKARELMYGPESHEYAMALTSCVNAWERLGQGAPLFKPELGEIMSQIVEPRVVRAVQILRGVGDTVLADLLEQSDPGKRPLPPQLKEAGYIYRNPAWEVDLKTLDE